MAGGVIRVVCLLGDLVVVVGINGVMATCNKATSTYNFESPD